MVYNMQLRKIGRAKRIICPTTPTVGRATVLPAHCVPARADLAKRLLRRHSSFAVAVGCGEPVRIAASHSKLLHWMHSSSVQQRRCVPDGRLRMSGDYAACRSDPVFRRSLSSPGAISESSAVHAGEAIAVPRLLSTALLECRLRREHWLTLL